MKPYKIVERLTPDEQNYFFSLLEEAMKGYGVGKFSVWYNKNKSSFFTKKTRRCFYRKISFKSAVKIMAKKAKELKKLDVDEYFITQSINELKERFNR